VSKKKKKEGGGGEPRVLRRENEQTKGKKTLSLFLFSLFHLPSLGAGLGFHGEGLEVLLLSFSLFLLFEIELNGKRKKGSGELVEVEKGEREKKTNKTSSSLSPLLFLSLCLGLCTLDEAASPLSPPSPPSLARMPGALAMVGAFLGSCCWIGFVGFRVG
jgi:hypothetical protein